MKTKKIIAIILMTAMMLKDRPAWQVILKPGVFPCGNFLYPYWAG